MLAAAQFTLGEVVADAAVVAVEVVVLVVDMLVKLVSSPKLYLMIAKCQNPILCLLSITCEMGNCSSRKKDQCHCQTHGCLLIVVPWSTSFCPQIYCMGYIKFPILFRFGATWESPYWIRWVILGITNDQCGTTQTMGPTSCQCSTSANSII